jgi:hypothetical protein
LVKEIRENEVNTTKYFDVQLLVFVVFHYDVDELPNCKEKVEKHGGFRFD